LGEQRLNLELEAHRPELGLVGSVSGDRWRGEVAGLDPAAVTVGGLEEQDVPAHGGKLARAVEARDATADDNNIGAPRRGQASSLGGPGKANNSSPPANRIPRIQ